MYPISYEADIPLEGRNRLTTFFRYFTAIPILIVAALFGIGAFFAVIVAWFSIVFTGRYPEGIYNFVGQALRINSRANSYFNLAVDQYPPFSGEDDPAYPVRVGLPAPLDSYNRVKAAFRIIVGIPVVVLAYIWSIILSVVSFVAWFAIMFTGKMPDGLATPIHMGLSYSTRAGGYWLLMTEDWPPFSDESGQAPAGEISSGTKDKSEIG